MKQLSSHNFEHIYQGLGIDVDKLGCVMASLEARDDMKYPYVDENDLYYAKEKSRFWINGWVCGKTPHITLLYGLLKPGVEYAPYIRDVLDGWEMKTAAIESVGYFTSNYEDEPYYCIIAHMRVTEQLLDAHMRLQFLPHINTFNEYRPHMTIAYIKKDKKLRDDLIDELNHRWAGKKLKVIPGVTY